MVTNECNVHQHWLVLLQINAMPFPYLFLNISSTLYPSFCYFKESNIFNLINMLIHWAVIVVFNWAKWQICQAQNIFPLLLSFSHLKIQHEFIRFCHVHQQHFATNFWNIKQHQMSKTIKHMTSPLYTQQKVLHFLHSM